MAFFDTLSKFEQDFVMAVRAKVQSLGHNPLPPSAILEDGVVTPVDDIVACLWRGKHAEQCVIGREEVGGYEISTIFSTVPVGRSGRGSKEKLLYFETLIWGPNGETAGQKYETLEQARQGHASMLACLLNKVSS